MISFFVDNSITLISIFVTLISILWGVYSNIQSNKYSRELCEYNEKVRKQREKEYNDATKNLSLDIEGKWYSAEFDLKHGIKREDWGNAILAIEILRKNCGNEIEIVTGEQLNNSVRETAWSAKGKVITENTLVLDWQQQHKINNSIRYGSCFMQFIENGRGIGYWIGYASNKSWLPVYGYWILSKDKNDLTELAELALNEFEFVNVKELIENKEMYRKNKSQTSKR